MTATATTATPPPRQRSVLDRSIVTVLPHPDETASRKDGISGQIERLHRLHGTSLIYAAIELLPQQGSASTYATACTMFHRFFHQVSLRKCDVWSVSMASLLLAAKVEDVTPSLTIRQVLRVFGHLYRKRRLLLLEDTDTCQQVQQQQATVITASPLATSLTLEAKQELLKQSVVPQSSLSQLGPVWKEWHETLVKTENQVLRHLGFCLYWIPDRHAHKWLVHACRAALDESSPHFAPLLQQAWNYCNDSYRLDLCVRFEPEVIASAAVYLALLDLMEKDPTARNLIQQEPPWWQTVCGEGRDLELSTAGNAILGICSSETSKLAAKAFVVSLIPDGGSFNDPGTFLWESIDGDITRP